MSRNVRQVCDGDLRFRKNNGSGSTVKHIRTPDDGPVKTTDNGGEDGGNTLNEAYNEGGPGEGRTIVADAGPVQILGADGLVVGGKTKVEGTIEVGNSMKIDGSANTINSTPNLGLQSFGGNVGVGTTSPDTALHISTSAPFGGITIQTKDNDLNQGLLFRNTGPSFTWMIHRTPSEGNQAELVFRGGVAVASPADLPERMRITTDGNVGIGTDSPRRPLVIRGTGSNGEWLGFKEATNGTTVWSMNNGRDGLNFVETEAARSRLFLRPGGRVGIGTTRPQDALHIVVTAQDATLQVEAVSAGKRSRIRLKTTERNWSLENDEVGNVFKIRDSTAGKDRLVIDSTGKVIVPGILDIGLERVTGDSKTCGKKQFCEARAMCPSDKRVLGGGFMLEDIDKTNQPTILDNRPLGNLDGWKIRLRNHNALDKFKLTPFALCAKIR